MPPLLVASDERQLVDLELEITALGPPKTDFANVARVERKGGAIAIFAGELVETEGVLRPIRCSGELGVVPRPEASPEYDNRPPGPKGGERTITFSEAEP